MLTLAATGGYRAVQMRAVAERAGIAVGTLYGYFSSKNHLLASALVRQFHRLEEARDGTTSAATPERRLAQLTSDLHDRWQRAPLLTEAMTKAFCVVDSTAAAAVNEAAAMIEHLLAATLGGGQPSDLDRRVAEVIAAIWVANITAFVGGRASASQTRDRIDRATRRLLDNVASVSARQTGGRIPAADNTAGALE